jgi:hypothetical protein
MTLAARSRFLAENPDIVPLLRFLLGRDGASLQYRMGSLQGKATATGRMAFTTIGSPGFVLY